MQRTKHDKSIIKLGVKILPVVLLVLFHIQVFGGTLTDYKSRLQSAENTLQDLIDYTKEIKGGAIKRDTDYENRVIPEMRKSLPPTEKIEWKGSAAETANRWLHDKLDLFQSENDTAKRLVILYETKERIAAISKEVRELENPPAANRTKDEDKQKLGEILQREEYKLPEKKDESLIQRWWREFKEWLESVFPKMKDPGPAGAGGPIFFVYFTDSFVRAGPGGDRFPTIQIRAVTVRKV